MLFIFSCDEELVEVLGCTNETACNFSVEANVADGSCEFPVTNHDCDNNCTAEVDCNSECSGTAFVDDCGDCSEGTTGQSENANLDVCGICDGDNSTCTGCMDILGCNYDVNNVFDDGSCSYPDDIFGNGYSCSGLCIEPEVCGNAALEFDNVDYDSAVINYSSTYPISGFEFQVSGVELTNAHSEYCESGLTWNSETGVVEGYTFIWLDLPITDDDVFATIYFVPQDQAQVLLVENVTLYYGDTQNEVLSSNEAITVTVPACVGSQCD